MQLINRATPSVDRQHEGSAIFTHCVGLIGNLDVTEYNLDVFDSSLTDAISLSAAELWPAAVCEEQHGRVGVV